MREDGLLELVWQHDELADLDAGARRLALRSLVADALGSDDVSMQVDELMDVVDGFGPITSLMRDDSVTDVLINGSQQVWFERAGRLHLAPYRLPAEELQAVVDRMLLRANARADISQPLGSGRLPDGSRMQVVLPPIAPHGPLVAIRKFPRRALALSDLADSGMVGEAEQQALEGLVRDRTSILISGATGTGKTTLLNALLGCVTDNERVITIEETPELRPACSHWASLVAREVNAEGRGEVDLMTLVRTALRMRPDRIVVGEVRGPEALAALDAMSTGPEGSMLTVHARSPQEALRRMTTLALSGRSGASERSLQEQVRLAFGAVVHLEREGGGPRRVAAIARVG